MTFLLAFYGKGLIKGSQWAQMDHEVDSGGSGIAWRINSIIEIINDAEVFE